MPITTVAGEAVISAAMITKPRQLFASLKGYRSAWLGGDMLAALMLVAIAIPGQLATAVLVGMPVETGLIAFVCGSLAFAAFGINRILSVGADSTIAPLIAAGALAVAAVGTPHYAMTVIALSLMVGVLLLLARPLRLGWIADLLSVPVTTGFLAGIAVHIIVGQLPVLMDFTSAAASLTDRIGEAVAELPAANLRTLTIGLGVFAFSLLGDRTNPKLPVPLIAIVISAVATSGLHLAGKGVPVMAGLSIAVPQFGLALPDWSEIISLLPAALVIAILCMMQTAAVEQSGNVGEFDRDATARDFSAIGVGSITSALSGAFAVNASPPRTDIISRAGGRTQAVGLIAAFAVVVLALAFANLFTFVPKAALAGVLLFIGVRIVRFGTIMRIFRASRIEFGLVLASAALVIVMPVGVGVGLSIVLSMMQSIYAVARPNCTQLARVAGTTIWWSPGDDEPVEYERGVLVFAPDGPLNFTNVGYIVAVLEAQILTLDTPCYLVVIEASGVIDIDFTGAQIMGDAVADLQRRNIIVALARMDSTRAKLAALRTGLVAQIGAARIFHSVDEAIATLAQPTPIRN